jgi:hypothetical protein
LSGKKYNLMPLRERNQEGLMSAGTEIYQSLNREVACNVL